SRGRWSKPSALVNAPRGLPALPMTSTGQDRPDEDGPRPGIEGAKSSGMAIAAKTLAAALIPLLIAVSLVALPGPANDAYTSSRPAVWKADEGWCLGALAPFIFASHHPLRELFDPELVVRNVTRSSP